MIFNGKSGVVTSCTQQTSAPVLGPNEAEQLPVDIVIDIRGSTFLV